MDNDAHSNDITSNSSSTDNKTYNKRVEKLQEYAITITYRTHTRLTPKGQFSSTITHLTKLLHQSTEFEIVPEWRVTTGDLHFHGTIRIKDRIKWIKRTLGALKRLGHILVKPIDNKAKWQCYLDKEKDIAKAILGEINLPITKVIEVVKVKPEEKQTIPDLPVSNGDEIQYDDTDTEDT